MVISYQKMIKIKTLIVNMIFLKRISKITSKMKISILIKFFILIIMIIISIRLRKSKITKKSIFRPKVENQQNSIKN